ncbi:MAG: divalent metal cation transporter [Opitutales bacterium]
MKDTTQEIPAESGYEDNALSPDALTLKEAQSKGAGPKLAAYIKLSGPGWLQSAITLGGGSLTGSLYLGVLAGFSMLWLQPLAMIFGIIMLSAIGYVTMSTGERPFQAIKIHINPVLAWGWAMASLAASMVWALPQYSLANGVLQQNLFPVLLGPDGPVGDFGSKLIISITILVLTTAITWNYGRGGVGVRLYELILKIMVAIIVICFAGVVIRLALSPAGLDWGALWRGFLPNPVMIFRPAEGFGPLLAAIPDGHAAYWSDLIVSRQRDVMVAAAATAVGINMTFLFPYSILRRRWGKEFRGFMKFDLGTGMFIPFVLATSCVVIAAASQFHTVPQPGVIPGEGGNEEIVEASASAGQLREYNALLSGRVLSELSPEEAEQISDGELEQRIEALGASDKYMAAMLVTRDAFDLATALEPFTGDFFGRILFGIGVLGMTLSSITLLMLISGFVICEVFNLPHSGWPLRIGSLAAATGVLGPFIWGQAAFWLAIPTSVFGFILIPIAYLTFFLMMNQRTLLGKEMPRGGRRVAWNLTMGIAVIVFGAASISMVWQRAGTWGIAFIALFLGAAAVAHFMKKSGAQTPRNP